MTRISAAENIIIDISPNRWRLIETSDTGMEHAVMDAASGEPLRYSTQFAATRRLPGNGALPADYVWQVVLGWSNDDEAWHLGLLLARDLADARGSRWCQLAYWPDPDIDVFYELAGQAGQALAKTLGRPFNLIPARKRVIAEPPLPELPEEIGQWKLEKVSDDEIYFTLSPRWTTSRLLRAVWYVFWVVVYLVLSIATLNANLALPNGGTMLPDPELLPYLGLGAAGVLLIMTLYIFYEIFTRPNRIVIGGPEQNVMALHNKSPRWKWNKNDLQSVYVTQVVNKKGSKRTIYHGEINLHMGNGDFYKVMEHPQQEDALHDNASLVNPPQETIAALTPNTVISDLQAVGLHIGKLLGGLPVWYDQRTR